MPKEDEIEIEAYDPGELRVVEMHDGSWVKLRKLETDYDPADRMGAMHRLQWAQQNQELVTGLVYYDDSRPSLAESSHLTDTPLNALEEAQIRPGREALADIMSGLM